VKTLALLILTATISSKCLARAVLALDMNALMAGSELVLVGKIKSVEPSGITTELTYPTWDNIVFEWLKVEVEVIEPIKGTKMGDVIRTLMLSTRGRRPIMNAPGMVDPKTGQLHLLCLLPTKFKSVYASTTAPFDEDQAVFILDRAKWEYYGFGDDPIQADKFLERNERCKIIWSLVDESGRIIPKGAEELRKKYQAEITTKPPKDAIIHLQWKKETSEDGWQWNVPDENAVKKKQDGAEQPVPRSKAK
jgi:hypothetical protein